MTFSNKRSSHSSFIRWRNWLLLEIILHQNGLADKHPRQHVFIAGRGHVRPVSRQLEFTFAQSMKRTYPKSCSLLLFPKTVPQCTRNVCFSCPLRCIAQKCCQVLLPLQQSSRELETRFHEIYELAQADGTLRIDIPENEIFSTTLHLMLAAVTRYAVGLVYQGGSDPEKELMALPRIPASRRSAPLWKWIQTG